MQTYISMLRGINVSGQKMIKMETLRKMYETLNFKNVESYIQSGNVIFQNKETKCQDLEKQIAEKIKKEFGFEVPVMVKEIDELKIVLKNNPFKADPATLHVTFLSQLPNSEGMEKIKDGDYGEDKFVVREKTVYLSCPNGYGRTKLTNNFFENKLKAVATTRNWKTVSEVVKIATRPLPSH